MSTQATNHKPQATGPVLVVGLGATGLSVARYLARRGTPFAVTDSRAEPPKAKELAELGDVPHRFGGFEAPLPLDEIAEAVVSPGVPLDEPFIRQLRSAGIPVIGDIELFARMVGYGLRPSPTLQGSDDRRVGRAQQNPPLAATNHKPQTTGHKPHVIAITGSNGKSTAAALVAAMAEAAGLKVALGGNFGTPALDLLEEAPDLYVLELSSFQLELTESLAPAAATVLNVSPDHIDRHGSLERYAALKARIFRNAATAVLNADDPIVAAMDTGNAEVQTVGWVERSETHRRPLQTTNWHLQNDDAGRTWLCKNGEPFCPADELALRGRHNLGNALAALALGTAIGLPADAMRTALREFAGLPHRCRRVARVGEVDYVDDSKATNVGAMLAALEGLPGPIVLLAGGQAKGGDFTPVAAVMAAKGRAAVLFGIDAGRIEAVLAGVVPVHRAANMDEAVTTAATAARPGDTVLLSPGCASFDLFRDYRDRGERFAAAVRRLPA